QNQADGHETRSEDQTDDNADVTSSVKAPAKAADQIDDGIEQADGAPRLGQHVDRVESAAEERKRRNDQRRNDRQLLEVLRPDANDENEQAERNRRQQQERDHPDGMEDANVREKGGGDQDDQADRYRLGRRGTDKSRDSFDR